MCRGDQQHGGRVGERPAACQRGAGVYEPAAGGEAARPTVVRTIPGLLFFGGYCETTLFGLPERFALIEN